MNRKTLRLFTLGVALLALPLTAPTCSSNGALHAFSANSLIIPMDACYQRGDGTNGALPAYCVGSPQQADDGIYRAYGLVYFLIKHGVAVYWVIDPNKTAVAGIDMTLVGSGEPVTHYDWAGGATSFLQGHTQINYRGGPFVVDGVDHDRVITLLQSDPDFAQFRSGAGSKVVDIHISAAGFQAPIARTLAGTPPTLALLNIKGGDNAQSVGVLQDYLTAAGLNFQGAGGAAQGPIHGSIYDTLAPEDFVPDGTGKSLLNKNGYKLLWVPHWEGPSSKLTGGGTMNAGQLQTVLTNIGQFADTGGNLFIECAGIGTAEGAYSFNNNTLNNSFGAGTAISESLSVSASNGGVKINSPQSPVPGPYTFNFPSSPFSQIGDFPLSAESGAINDYAVRPNGAYVSNAQRMIVESNNADLFTVIPNKGNVATAGTVVYLGGHEYYTDTGNNDVAGIRLVLNTLFNLSATCVDPNTPCNTGLPGACSVGVQKCDASGNVVCQQSVQPQPERCDGIDNDCNGLIDDVPPQSCYDGPAGSAFTDGGGVGPCRQGQQSCLPLTDGGAAFGICVGEIVPTDEVCNGVDDDCDGNTDVLPDGGAITEACYDGPLGTENVGICRDGTAICNPATGTFGSCSGEQTPLPPACNDGGVDNNCDGSPDPCSCADGDSQPCYNGPPGTAGVGICHAGTSICLNGQFGPCTGEQDPQPEQCNDAGLDYNCNGLVGDGCVVCNNGDTRPCYDGPGGSLLPDGGPIGVCHRGVEICENNLWGTCQQEVVPGNELCDGLDNDCNGNADDNATCPPTQACINGTCTPATCSSELGACAEGFKCTDGACLLSNCGTGAPCPVGQRCSNGACVDPCAGVICGAGSTCSGGGCVAGGCFDSPCSAGQVCEGGQCVTDPCDGIVCPDGDFCSQGYCVQSCVFVSCGPNQVCDIDGQCAPAPCNGSCSAQDCLADGGCGADVCNGVSCAAGQVCVNENGSAACVGDPCAGVSCPAGFCLDGQCTRTLPDGGQGTSTTTGTSGTTATTATTAGTTGHTSTTSGTSTTGTHGASSGSTGTHGASGSSGGSTGASSATSGANASNGVSASANGGSTGGTSGASSGCGCNSSADISPFWLAAGLLFLVRRRQRGAASALALPLVIAAASTALIACGGGTTSTAGGNTTGTSATTVGSGSTTTTTSATATSGSTGTHASGSSGTTASSNGTTSGTTGSGCATGQAKCGGTCVDVLASADHCGNCSTQCSPDETCDQGFCAPNAPVNPTLSDITPNHASPGAQLTVILTGTLFDPQGVAHFTGGGANDQIFSTTIDSDTQAHVVLDLTGLVAGPASIRMVNPGRVVSNAVAFTIGGASTPTLVSLTPAQSNPGVDVPIDVKGTLFDSTTIIHVTGAGLIDFPLPTTFVAGNEVNADFALGGFPDGGGSAIVAGTYQLFAINSGSPPSNELPFTVLSATPTLTSLTPPSASIGAQVSLTGHGTNFDPSTVLHFQLVDGGGDQALTTNFIRADTVQVPDSAPLDLTGLDPGVYQIVAANQQGAKLSSPVAFTINSNSPHLTSLAPSSGLQGSTLPVTVNGTGFDSTSAIHFLVNGNDTTEATTVVNSNQLTCTLDLTQLAAGPDQVVVFNSGNLASNTLRFTVLSNVAILTSLSVQGAGQGTQLAETLSGVNFLQGAVVHVAGQGLSQDVTPSGIISTQIQFTGLDLTSFPTGSYLFTVVNPGAQPSQGLPFTVEPGTPTVSGISPSPVPMNSVQTFTVSGALFAQGATVHVTGTGVDTSYPTTFVDTGTLAVSNVSLANVPAGQYSVSVVNPGPHESSTVNLHITWPDGGG